MVEVCRASGRAIEWLADRCGIPLRMVEGFLYRDTQRCTPCRRQGAH